MLCTEIMNARFGLGICWFGGLLVWWLGGLVVCWLGGLVVGWCCYLRE